jgi:hypothetical protein
VGLLAGLVAVLAGIALGGNRHPAPALPPDDTESKNLQERWETTQRELAAGRPVILIGETGAPSYFRWRCGGPTANVALAGDGTFSAHHLEYGLLELLPDPLQERYRFRAEVRHDQGVTIEGEVGIYFSHSEHASARRHVHCYGAVVFNDLVDQTGVRHDARPPANPVALRVHQQPPTGLDCLSGVVGQLAYPFALPLPDQRPWRRVAVEVTPERVRVLCEGKCITDSPRAEFMKRVKDVMRRAPDELTDEPAFAPRGGLGLVVRQAAASFRSVAIEPLGDGK